MGPVLSKPGMIFTSFCSGSAPPVPVFQFYPFDLIVSILHATERGVILITDK